MASDEDQIREVVASWMRASKAGDTEAVLALMTDDVVFLLPGRTMNKAEFAAASRMPPGTPAPSIDGRSNIQEIQIAGDWAWMRNQLTVVVTPPGGQAITRAGHTLTIFRRENGRWLLARDANLLAPVG